ncbi:MAG: glycosyltransferase [Acidimicrobiales bacterium]
MRILVVHNAYRQAGGEDAVVARDVALLRERGHDVATFIEANDAIGGPFARALVAARATYATAPRDRLAAMIAACRPDVVHAHNLFPLLSPAIYDACRDARVPVVQTLHNYRLICPAATLLRDGRPCELCVTGSAYQAVRYGCYRGSRLGSLAVARLVEHHRRAGTWSSKVDRFVALSRFAKGRLVAGGLPAELIAVSGNFAADRGPPDDGAERHGLLYVGRLGEEKGIRVLLAAAARAGVALRVAGDGPLAPLVRAAAGVTFLGPLAAGAVAAEMARAAALVVPSLWYEAFPMVLVEAFAAGLPVLASGLGSLAELVEDGVTGRHVTPGSADALADAMVWAVANGAVLAGMGRRARAIYEAEHTPDAAYARMVAIYRSVGAP